MVLTVVRIDLLFFNVASVASVPKLVGWQTCNNITSGPTALQCDDTLGLYCYSNNTCQCLNTMYWDINDQLCGMKN